MIVPAMNPSPPACIAIRITTRPNWLQWVPVSTTTSPQVATAEVAVKSASQIGVTVPSAEANGRVKSTAATSVMARNPITSVYCGERRRRSVTVSMISTWIARPTRTGTMSRNPRCRCGPSVLVLATASGPSQLAAARIIPLPATHHRPAPERLANADL